MENATRLQNLEVLGDLEVHGATKNGGMKEADFKVTAADAAAAAGAAPTKAEFDAVVIRPKRAGRSALPSLFWRQP